MGRKIMEVAVKTRDILCSPGSSKNMFPNCISALISHCSLSRHYRFSVYFVLNMILNPMQS